MNVIELIETKRDGGHLSGDEIRWLINEYAHDRVPSYQMAAMAMAIFLNGLSSDELGVWTEAMMYSGEVLDLSRHRLPKIDKHSTGGVGDKISIPLAPMVAACGVAVPMISGRALGHTGGTLDKLETIPGFKTDLSLSEFVGDLHANNLVLAGQSEALVPADRRLYALRDATGTVASIPLIASSIMSKKLAEGLDALVLDVKFGSGAFMQDFDDARKLAQTMISIGEAQDTPVTAFLTDMTQPLGCEIGNASEIRESLDVLNGGGPTDVVELTLALGAEMLILAKAAPNEQEARERLLQVIDDGSALALLAKVVSRQGGDPTALYDPSLLADAEQTYVLKSSRSGYVARADARRIGVAARRLGAGRKTMEDQIDPGVGITMHAKVGDWVAEGEPLATVAWNQYDRFSECMALLDTAWEISESSVEAPPLIAEVLRSR